jgi:hypothetical protein
MARGVGQFLLTDALRRSLGAAAEIAALAVLVDAKDEAADAFYRHFGFVPLQQRPRRLFLPMKTTAMVPRRGPRRDFEQTGPPAVAPTHRSRVQYEAMQPTFGELSATPRHRSFFRLKLQEIAGARPLDEWLVEEANVRGYFGAVGVGELTRPPTDGLSDEALIVAILMPHTPADGRLFKLVLRMVQRAQIDVARLWFWAKREQADGVLFWLLSRVPEAEMTPSVVHVLSGQRRPRGYRPLNYNYDTQRLIRRVATKESVCRAAQKRS